MSSLENRVLALSLYQLHLEGSSLTMTFAVTIMSDLTFSVGYRGMVVDPQKCGVLSSISSSISSGIS